ncbi:unnamed protein product, partial [Ceratitis capitata]
AAATHYIHVIKDEQTVASCKDVRNFPSFSRNQVAVLDATIASRCKMQSAKLVLILRKAK